MLFKDGEQVQLYRDFQCAIITLSYIHMKQHNVTGNVKCGKHFVFIPNRYIELTHR